MMSMSRPCRFIDVFPEKSEAQAVQLRNPQASAFNWHAKETKSYDSFCLKLQCTKLRFCLFFAVPATFMVNEGLILNLDFQDLHLPFSHKEQMCENLRHPRDENLNFRADWIGPRLAGHHTVKWVSAFFSLFVSFFSVPLAL